MEREASKSESEHATTSFVGWVSDLARDHTAALARLARSEGLTADDALDAVQEAFQTFLGLPQARVLVGDADDSRALLSVVVRNAARNLRKTSRVSEAFEIEKYDMRRFIHLPVKKKIVSRYISLVADADEGGHSEIELPRLCHE